MRAATRPASLWGRPCFRATCSATAPARAARASAKDFLRSSSRWDSPAVPRRRLRAFPPPNCLRRRCRLLGSFVPLTRHLGRDALPPCAGQSVIVVCLKTVGRRTRTRTPGLLLAEGLVSEPQTAQEGGWWPNPGVELSKEQLSHIYHAWGRLSVR